MSILEEKEKLTSLLSIASDLITDSQDYSEIISFLERIRNFQLPQICSSSISSSISLKSLRKDF